MGNSYRWVIVAAGALMGCIAMGAMFSLAIFLEPIATETGWSRAGISSAMTLNFIVMGLGGFAWGAASDRYGAKVVVMIGAVLVGLALVLASQSASLLQFQLAYGVLIGISTSAFFAPLIATTMGWFEERQRGLAVSLVSVGMGVAPMTVSPIARILITAYDWRTAMLIIGVAAWAIILPATLLIRRPPMTAAEGAPADHAGESGSMTVGQALRSPQFLVLGFTFFACCAAHSGPIFHMVSYAMFCGLAPMAAVSIYSIEGLAGLGGRVLFGVAADRLGVKQVLIAGLLVQAAVIPAYLLARDMSHFYALAVIFGATYGGVMPLYAVLARTYFGQQILGAVLGAATMLSSLGMAFGPLAGGYLFDTAGNYNWLFIGSGLVGLGAVAIALFFPPLRPAVPRRLQPAE